MANSKQETHNIFFDQQKSNCNKHTFPSNGDDTLTVQSVMIKNQNDAMRIYKDKSLMETMYADGFVWNPTLNKKGVMKFKFSRQISIDHVSHFNDDPEDVTRAYHKVGIRIGMNNDVDNKYLPMLGIHRENKAQKVINKMVEKLAKHMNISYDEAFAIIG